MNLEFSEEEQAFRDEVREFLASKLPKEISHRVENTLDLTREHMVQWQKILYEQGWIADSWPVEYGGTGWTPVQKYIFSQECAKAHAPRLIPFGLKMVGPVIYTYGNEAQKKRFLPDILATDVWWCQGYSEPNSGSDLASLKTTAVRDGDDYLVNGTKTWTTLAQYADWMFCLVRTAGPEVKAQQGISFILIDLQTEGITISPIITLDGRHEVNEVHFENVRVPAENLIGEENMGWTYAKFLLRYERLGIAQVALQQQRLAKVAALAEKTPGYSEKTLAEDPQFCRKLAEIEIDLQALEYTELRTLSAMTSGAPPGPESSILKIKGTEIGQLIDELFLELAGHYALPFVPEQFSGDFDGESIGPWFAANSGRDYFNHRKTSIYGGSNEIQKNIICKMVLGL